jgi:hypothetical protein
MNAGDRRTLARLLKSCDGDWDKLRRDFEAVPQPKRGRPSGGTKLIDDYLLITLPRYCENSGLKPFAAIRSFIKEAYDVTDRNKFRDVFGASPDAVTRRLYKKMKDGKRLRQLEQAAAEMFK